MGARAAAAAVGVGVVALAAVAVAVVGYETAAEPVGPVVVAPDLTDDALDGALDGAVAGLPRQVPALDRFDGELEPDGGDPGEVELDGRELDLGPGEWVLTAGPIGDLDGDGLAEPLLDELEDLLGSPVSVLGILDSDGDEIDVYEINGVPFRDTGGGPAPWERPSGTGSGEVSSRDDVAAAAIAAVPGGGRIADIDQVDGAGDVAWEVEVVGGDGAEFDVLLDAGGQVLDVRPD